jgi:hypothetical protein
MAGSCTSHDDGGNEIASGARQPIITGTPVADPPNSGVVYLTSARAISSVAQVVEHGSGTLLSNEWILTAAHVVYNAAAPGQVEVRRGNADDPNAEVRRARRIDIHPGYDAPTDPNFAAFSTDIALVQVDPPFSGAPPLSTISDKTTDAIWALDATTCFGYGWTDCGTAHPGTLTYAEDFDPSSANAVANREFTLHLNPLGQAIWKSDSGGPCVLPGTHEVLGVIRAGDNRYCPLHSDWEGSIVSAQAFRDWANFARTTLVSAYADFDHDWRLDWVGFTQNEARIFYAKGGTYSIPLPAGVNIISTAKVALGDFNNDTWPDLLVSAAGQFLYLSGANLAFLPPSLTFAPIFADYSAFVTRDLNGDGYEDAEATRADGSRDLYFGSPAGLDNGTLADGWPTTDGNDGKFLALVSSAPGLATPENNYMSFFIVAEKSAPYLDVQLFDGDMDPAGRWDVGDPGGAVTCYGLWFLPDGDPSSPNPPNVAFKTSAEFGDDQWEKVTAEDRIDNAWYASQTSLPWVYYVLDVYLSQSGDCSEVSSLSAPMINPYKVRATGQISMAWGDLAFLGGGVSGEYVSTDKPSDQILRDTTYDGEFLFWFYAPPNSTEAILVDADADITVDDQPDGTRGPLDVKADGVATGVSPNIRYRVYDINGNVVFTNTNPSGNNNGDTQTDREELKVPISEGWWIWDWQNVMTHNDVRIWVPFASPAQYQMFTKRSEWRSPSAAIALVNWKTEGVSSDLLPIAIGSGSNQFVISTSNLAGIVLNASEASVGGAPSGKQTICHGIALGNGKPKLITIAQAAVPAHVAHGDDTSRPTLMSELAAELLAAKLNVAAAHQFGQRLENAHVYGRTVTVASVIAQGDSALRLDVSMCAITDTDVNAVNSIIDLLRAINGGYVTFAPLHQPHPRTSGTKKSSANSTQQTKSPPASWVNNF